MSKLDAQHGGTPVEFEDSAHGSKFPGPKADMEGKPEGLLEEPEYVGKSEWADSVSYLLLLRVAWSRHPELLFTPTAADRAGTWYHIGFHVTGMLHSTLPA